MDLNPSPPDLFHLTLPDANVNSSQQGAWRCTLHNKKIRAERGAVSKRGKKSTFHPQIEARMYPEFNTINLSMSSQHFVIVSIFVSASSHKLFPVLLMVGWIVGCIAVVYFVFIFAWVGYIIPPLKYIIWLYVGFPSRLKPDNLLI